MKTRTQWKYILLWLPLISGLAASGVFVSDTGASETIKNTSGHNQSGQIKTATQPEFKIKHVSTALDKEVYRLDALIEYNLSNAVLEALVSGVPITIELQVAVVIPREWIWDKRIAQLSQKYRVEYYALTRQYLVTNINSQSQNIYSSQQQALHALGVITQLPLIDKHLVNEDQQYNGQLRARLLIAELPAPLRVLAYLSSEWRLASEWFIWQLR